MNNLIMICWLQNLRAVDYLAAVPAPGVTAPDARDIAGYLHTTIAAALEKTHGCALSMLWQEDVSAMNAAKRMKLCV